MDWLPVVSQLKSAVQAITGDTEGARKTQENFVNQCPIVSQSKSAVQAISGDREGAERTQWEFVHAMEATANNVPVIGHVKGAIHYAVGDKEGGDSAMKGASRTTVVIGGGLVGGPVGAVTAGIGIDGLITGLDSAVHGHYRPHGNVENVTKVVEDPSKIRNYVNVVVTPVVDVIAGQSIGSNVTKGVTTGQIAKIQVKAGFHKGMTKKALKDATKEASEHF